MTDPIDRAADALRADPVPPGPPPDLLAATVAALTPPGGSAPRPVPPTRRRRLMRIVGFSTAATAAAIAVAVGLFGLGGRAPAAELADALDNVKAAKSYRMTVSATVGGKKLFEMRSYLQGDRMRFEAPGVMVMIADAKGNVLHLDPAAKTASRPTLDELAKVKPAKEVEEFVRRVREMKGEGVTALPDEMLDGRAVKVFTVTGVTLNDVKSDWKVWVDPGRKVPVRLEMATPADPKVVVTTEYADWDKEFDAKLFDTTVPEGYTVVEWKRPDVKPAPKPAVKPAQKAEAKPPQEVKPPLKAKPEELKVPPGKKDNG